MKTILIPVFYAQLRKKVFIHPALVRTHSTASHLLFFVHALFRGALNEIARLINTHFKRMRTLPGLMVISLLILTPPTRAQEIQIQSLSQNGLLTWTNSTLNVTCRVEWAATAEGPWFRSWDSLSDILITNQVTARNVPMFYRVVAVIPVPPVITNITPVDALTLIQQHPGDTNFVILDVRTPSEYSPRHMKNAVNLDIRSATFQQEVAKLDRQKIYLVYCASGGRSAQATDILRQLGFSRVYNMQNGFASFAALSGAAIFLEP